MDGECQICCENFNMSTRSKIICENSACAYECCKTCVRKYLLSTAQDPHCMNCRHGWGQKFLVENLNRSFISNDYKEHRQKLLMERELSRMPETIDAADRHRRSERELLRAAEVKMQINQLKDELNDLKSEEWRHQNRSRRILRGAKKNNDEKRSFIMACPSEDCRGFLSTQYKMWIMQTTNLLQMF